MPLEIGFENPALAEIRQDICYDDPRGREECSGREGISRYGRQGQEDGIDDKLNEIAGTADHEPELGPAAMSGRKAPETPCLVDREDPVVRENHPAAGPDEPLGRFGLFVIDRAPC